GFCGVPLHQGWNSGPSKPGTEPPGAVVPSGLVPEKLGSPIPNGSSVGGRELDLTDCDSKYSTQARAGPSGTTLMSPPASRAAWSQGSTLVGTPSKRERCSVAKSGTTFQAPPALGS